MTQNQLTYLRDQENLRHNLVMEAETYRSNRVHEALQDKSIRAGLASAKISAAASRYGASVSAAASRYGADLNYEINSARNVETERSNMATEAQNKRNMWAKLAGDVVNAAARVFGKGLPNNNRTNIADYRNFTRTQYQPMEIIDIS